MCDDVMQELVVVEVVLMMVIIHPVTMGGYVLSR
jgi:hypothetical protein